MTKLALLTSTTCAVVLLAAFASAQDVNHVDIAAGGSTLYSFATNNSSLAYIPPVERGGTFTGLSAAIVLKNHYGLFAEGSWRYHKTLYNGYQEFRPAFFDVNVMYSRHVAHKTQGELMAGVGDESLIFYNQFGICGASACGARVSANHFAVHAGADLRYHFLKAFFIRPEIHYYLIPDNAEFRSDHVLRLGASIGYTFGSRSEPKPKQAPK